MMKLPLSSLWLLLLALPLPAASGLLTTSAEPAFSAPPAEPMRADDSGLREAILRAFARHPRIAEAAAQIQVSRARLDEAKSGWYPQIALQGSAGHADSTRSDGAGGVTLSQLLYDFGKTRGRVDEQERLTEANRFALYDTLTRVAQETLLAWLDAKRQQTLAQASREQLSGLEDIARLATLRAEAGLNSDSDKLQAQTRIDGMRASEAQYQALEQAALARLSVLTGDANPQLGPLPPLFAREPLKRIDYESTSAVRSAREKQRASDERVRQAQADRWPTLKAEAGRTRYINNGDGWWDDSVQLRVNAPLYQGGAINARVQAAEGEREAARAEVEQAQRLIDQSAANANAALTGAKARLRAGERQYQSAVRTREVYRNEYQLGKRSLNDLLSSEQDLFQAQITREEARFDAAVASVNYAAAADTLLDWFDIDRSAQSGDTLPSL
ncbi:MULTISPECIES: TolC family outer membrane protein [Franconibacter]|uniref:TolC family outer membrane protein n=1 Tax=Franconibacter daqui TaxID=2047724 RepID=A0ABV1PL14_9ENTR|nr:TolC family outer membrane protein [Franconibacter sp. IITDAS19]MCK1970398.1 TolC family outer membrane protein [Franconibacter sp. IITDAS19]